MGFTGARSLTDRFTWLFDGLCKVIGFDARKQRVEAALAWAIWHRVRVLGDRLIALAERVRAGRVTARRVLHAATPHPVPPPQGGRERQPPAHDATGATAGLPREFGWVRRMLPETGQYAGVLAYLLRDPETVALLEQAPQAGRMLRPLCQMLGVPAPEFLRRGAVGAPEAEKVAAVEAAQESGPRLTPAPSTPSGGEGENPGGGEGESADVAQPPPSAAPPGQAPPPSQSAAEEAALAYARRPGGLYWDGTRMRWS